MRSGRSSGGCGGGSLKCGVRFAGVIGGGDGGGVAEAVKPGQG